MEPSNTTMSLDRTATLPETVINSISDRLMALQKDGTILAINLTWAKDFGKIPQELVGKVYFSFVNPRFAEKVRKSLEESLNSGIVTYLETSLGGKWLDMMFNPMYDEKCQLLGCVVFTRDVTARKFMEGELAEKNSELAHTLEELKKTEQMLVRSEKLAAIGTLSAGVAHEILNPLNIIGTITQMMLIGRQDGEEKTNLEEIMIQIRRATKITNNLRKFARKKEAAASMIDAHALFDKTLSLMEHDLQLDNIMVDRDYGDDSGTLFADEDNLAQVFLNLLTNARDALRGKIGGDKKILVMTRALPPDMVEITVSDNGMGIPRNIIGKIFDPFFTTKSPDSGTGLGLSMANSFIEAMGGTMEVESAEGAGASFRIKLPRG